MPLEDVMLGEISHTRRANILWLFLIRITKTVQFLQTESNVVSGDWRGWNGK